MDQKLSALAEGNRIRFYRADLKKEIGRLSMTEGEHQVAELLLDPPEEILGMSCLLLMKSITRYSTIRSAKVWQCVDAKTDRRVGQLSDRQRQRLAVELLASRNSAMSRRTRLAA